MSLGKILTELGLGRYVDVFENEEMDLDTLLYLMDEEDNFIEVLKEMGIKAGPRLRLLKKLKSIKSGGSEPLSDSDKDKDKDPKSTKKKKVKKTKKNPKKKSVKGQKNSPKGADGTKPDTPGKPKTDEKPAVPQADKPPTPTSVKPPVPNAAKPDVPSAAKPELKSGSGSGSGSGNKPELPAKKKVPAADEKAQAVAKEMQQAFKEGSVRALLQQRLENKHNANQASKEQKLDIAETKKFEEDEDSDDVTESSRDSDLSDESEESSGTPAEFSSDGEIDELFSSDTPTDDEESNEEEPSKEEDGLKPPTEDRDGLSLSAGAVEGQQKKLQVETQAKKSGSAVVPGGAAAGRRKRPPKSDMQIGSRVNKFKAATYKPKKTMTIGVTRDSGGQGKFVRAQSAGCMKPAEKSGDRVKREKRKSGRLGSKRSRTHGQESVVEVQSDMTPEVKMKSIDNLLDELKAEEEELLDSDSDDAELEELENELQQLIKTSKTMDTVDRDDPENDSSEDDEPPLKPEPKKQVAAARAPAQKPNQQEEYEKKKEERRRRREEKRKRRAERKEREERIRQLQEEKEKKIRQKERSMILRREREERKREEERRERERAIERKKRELDRLEKAKQLEKQMTVSKIKTLEANLGDPTLIREGCENILADCNFLIDELKRAAADPKLLMSPKGGHEVLDIPFLTEKAKHCVSLAAVILIAIKSSPIDENYASELKVSVTSLMRTVTLCLTGHRQIDAKVQNEMGTSLLQVKTALKSVILSLNTWKADQGEEQRNLRLQSVPQVVKETTTVVPAQIKSVIIYSKNAQVNELKSAANMILDKINELVTVAIDARLSSKAESLRNATANFCEMANLRAAQEIEDDELLGSVQEVINQIKYVCEALLKKTANMSMDSSDDLSFSSDTKDGQTKMTDEEKSRAVRAKVVRELFETENTYLGQLDSLHKDFFIPLESWEKLCALNSIAALKVALPKIIELTKKLRDDLLTAMAAMNPDIGAIFLEHAHMFKYYQEYVNNYALAETKFKKAQKKKKSFDLFVKEFCRKGQGGDLGLYLILPIQRTPRYELLLRDLCKHTKEEELGLVNLQKALEKIGEINKLINIRKREDENRKKVCKIEKSIKSDEPLNLYVPGRWFQREGRMDDVVTTRLRGTQVPGGKYYYFLFSDVILKTKPIGNRKYKHQALIELSKFSITDIQSKDVAHFFALVMDGHPGFADKKKKKLNKPVSFKFSCISESEKISWMKDIGEAISVNKLMNDM
eukprot:CAMPEP_0174262040 /NCGR_PEP_ID=MMETSP0439-20130205/12734_1 /TAXON_ID=0 /ORGANISM="Stereomyxa ramosa, Strain Chinc5" /LENGTH=1256 /DNA_ID=CAMNT_0015346671 /DNA_START=43 /DNA_END=3813 /DNA_ORIENTATION=-